MDRPFRRAGARRRRGDAAAVRRAVRRDRLADVRADAPPVRRARRPDRARRAQPDAVLLRFGRDLGGARRPARLRPRRRGGDAGAAVLRRAARRAPRSACGSPPACGSGSPACRNTTPSCRRSESSPSSRWRPRQRPWLARPAPYLAALSRWRSSRRSSSGTRATAGSRSPSRARAPRRRAAGGQTQVGAMAIGEIAFLSPWIAAPLVAALIDGARRAARDERRLFLVCLALPTIVVFTLTPLWGAKGLPHWTMPGWLFVYPLLGAWLAEPRAAALDLRKWAIVCGGAARRARRPRRRRGGDRLRRRASFRSARARSTRRSRRSTGARCATRPRSASAAFVVATRWMDGGKVGLALGPDKPVFVFSDDPRGIASSPTAPTSSAATRRSSSPGTGARRPRRGLRPISPASTRRNR